MRPTRALIKVGYACNNHCTFCHTLDHREVMASGETILAKVDRAAELGHEMVVFSGGEPTIRRELTDWTRRARDRGLTVGLVSNGRMLAYPGLVERLLAHGLGYVHLSFHSSTAAIHDAVTRAESWAQTRAALENLSGRGLELVAACVVTRENLEHLRGVIDHLAPLSDVRIKLSMVEPKGAARALFDEVIPPVAEAARVTAEALRYGLERLPATRLSHEGFPFCLLEGFEHLGTGLRDHGFVHMAEADEADFFAVDERNKVHPPVCRDCALRGRCSGLFRDYAERRGTEEIGPARSGPRSNSFNYAIGFELGWETGSPCPILPCTTPYDRARSLFIRDGSRLRYHVAHTRDFADSDIEAAKLERGQIYIDAGEGEAPADFERDLSPLVLLDECCTCPARERCPGAFRVDTANPFTRERERLHERLAELRGDVLDIGCGAGRYAGALAPAAARGELHYRGIDPSPAALARFARAHPWAELREGSAEELDLEPAAWDAILLINSYNHVESPDRLLATIARALRPGGRLLVVDDVPYGLVRTAEQTRRAESGAAGFEHLRNHGAEEAARAVGRHLEVERIEPVRAGSSNQWYVGGVKSGES